MGRLKNMLIGKRLLIALGVLLTVVAAPVAIVLMNQYMNTEASSRPVTADVQSYADEWDISTDEAARRLALQDTIGELAAALEKNETDTFAGLWIKHGTDAADFGAVAHFTKDGERTLQAYGRYTQNGPLTNMVEIRTASKTLAELRTTRNEAMTELRRLGIPVESGINIKENKAEVYVAERGKLDSAISAANVRLPDKVELITVPTLSKRTSDIYGGLSASTCTLGFAVENQRRTKKGVTTAGHCRNEQSYNGTSLHFESEMYNSDRDVQWYTAPGFTVKSLIAIPYTRRVNGTRPTDQQTQGSYVCKYGETTGYGCGYIVETNFLPDDTGITCAPNPSCTFADTWIRVEGNNGGAMVQGGDSGGPVFKNDIAYGTIAWAFGDDAIYMPIDYIGKEGLFVLTD